MIDTEEMLKTFPNLREARVCAIQENYTLACDLYSEILNVATNENQIPEDDFYLSLIKIEYASSLIKSTLNFFQNELRLIANKQPIDISKRTDHEDDLEIAWEVLEGVRVLFEKEGNAYNEHLINVNGLLGEILLLNNDFDGAIVEFKKCIEMLESIEKRDSMKIAEFCDQIANCLEFSKKYNEAKEYLIKVILIYQENRDSLGHDVSNEMVTEILSRMADLENMQLQDEEKKLEELKYQDCEDEGNNSDVIIDINARKKKKNAEENIDDGNTI